MDLHLRGKFDLVTGASGNRPGLRPAARRGRLPSASRVADQGGPGTRQGSDSGPAQRFRDGPSGRSQQRRCRAVAGGRLQRHRHPGEQCRGHPSRRPADDRRAAVAGRLEPQGVRLRQYVPRGLSDDEGARRRRHRQRLRRRRRAADLGLHRRQRRQCLVDGFHPRHGRHQPGRQDPHRRLQSRPDQHRAHGDDAARDRQGQARRRRDAGAS